MYYRVIKIKSPNYKDQSKQEGGGGGRISPQNETPFKESKLSLLTL